ncbi:MAG: hypothetical protein OEY94_05630 [Alphaproteobacteria bacterium]|nr:hypothetical protein [Alphaproteobacteria bacterium]
MSEKILRIQGPDQNGIYGRIRETGSDKLIIHLHGMTHNMDHMLEVMSADFFTQHGFDHCRISLYARVDDSRNLANSTLSTHVRDIRAVLEHFRDMYREIYITAHSLSALAVLILCSDDIGGIKAISFWDPAFDVTHFWSTGDYLHYMPEYKQYQLNYGAVFVLGEDMVREIAEYPDAKCLELAGNCKIPVQMVIPEQSIFLASPHTSPENYDRAFSGPFSLVHIKGTDHRFATQGKQKELFEIVLKYFNSDNDVC